MKMSEFTYNLPEERIAKFPPKERGTTQLLVLDREEGSIKHRRYSDCVEYMREGDVIVLNETKVEKRRTYFLDNKERTHEVLFLNQQQDGNWFCLIKKSKQLNEKDILINLVCKEIQLQIVKKSEKGVIVKLLSDLNPKEVFEKAGHTPIPPYMKRDDTEEDFERYNTVFGKYFGSVASPTASLNLTEDLLEKIKKKGIKIAKVELKVGWGTFAPVREENIEDHEIHEEEISLSLTSADIINETIKNGGDVWVFGTTVARLLESCATKDGFVEAYEGSTNLYIYPGYEWKIVNHLITNFHMPDSSLILLVSSFAGKELIKKAYDEALENEYMLLSYGDSMLII
ncbi:MAG TPA: tRNA preQ1(34) S-adenosylmethionine ribosyltransferase-isomerase QueA [Candidatus Dojkabacteria bacterium]|jgi:S-adenosylmethionine:tRNA ribosyltransferase-isomerase|nr:tRNA preQ1(34) S-adenosylmethionine ribosyltransferase-isomerase QueA [Candidatus Dojkabacteria bacterium]